MFEERPQFQAIANVFLFAVAVYLFVFPNCNTEAVDHLQETIDSLQEELANSTRSILASGIGMDISPLLTWKEIPVSECQGCLKFTLHAIRWSFHPSMLVSHTVPCGYALDYDWILNPLTLSLYFNRRIPRSIFIRRPHLAWFVAIILPTLSSPVVLGLGDSDKVTYMTELEHLVRHPGIAHMFVENLNGTHPNVTAVATGMNPRDCPTRGLLACDTVLPIVEKHRMASVDYSRAVLVTQRVRPPEEYNDRRQVRDLCNAMNACHATTTPIPHSEMMTKRGKFSFNACPHGGGIDPSPSAFEALLMGSIPIIHNQSRNAYGHLPVVFVDNWDELRTFDLPQVRNLWIDKFAANRTPSGLCVTFCQLTTRFYAAQLSRRMYDVGLLDAKPTSFPCYCMPNNVFTFNS